MIATGATLSLMIAGTPIVLVLTAMVCRVPALSAGAIGVVAAVIGTVVAFPVSAHTIAATSSSMTGTFVTVAFILLGGVGLAEVTARSGMQNLIAGWLRSTAQGRDHVTVLILIAFGVTPFMESVTGFGLGVVFTAPVLIHLGLSPARAVTTGLLGLVLVPWGSLGPGTLVAADLGEVSFDALGVWSALFSLPVLCINVAAVLMVNRYRASIRQWLFIAGVVVIEWIVLIGANAAVGPPLAGVLASSTVIVLTINALRYSNRTLPALPDGFGQALLPYLVLVCGLLMSAALLAITGLDFLTIASNPAVWLIITVTVTILAQRRRGLDASRVVQQTVRRWWPVAAITLLFMLLGTIMSANGMAAELATSGVSTGFAFLIFVPILGAVGGYLTGSNTGAAAMFSTATTSAATQIGVSPLIALAVQNVAGSAAIIASPPRVALASSVAFEPGRTLPSSNLRILLSVLVVLVFLLASSLLIVAALT